MRGQGMMWAVLVATALSGSNAFAEGASAPATNPPTAEIAASADLWKDGAQAIPFLGMNSIAGDAGKGYGVGFRFGSLFGVRFAQNWSVNGEVVLDVLSPNSTPGQDTSGWNGDFAVAPLYHYPLAQVELVAGPTVGTFFQLGRAKNSLHERDDLGSTGGRSAPMRARSYRCTTGRRSACCSTSSCTSPSRRASTPAWRCASPAACRQQTMIGFSLAALL